MTPPLYPWQAEAARRELRAVEVNAADLLARRELTQAQIDLNIAGWRAIEQLLATGKSDTDLTWTELERVAGAALTRREEAVNANQDPARHRDFVARRDLVASIHRRIARNRDLIDGINAKLRDGAARDAA
jgi:hypothetical protein